MDQIRGNIAIVAHGTVISLLVAAANGLDGFELWRRLGLPSALLVEWPGLKRVRVLEQV
jgi:broad specificity phosphatase PhoE